MKKRKHIVPTWLYWVSFILMISGVNLLIFKHSIWGNTPEQTVFGGMILVGSLVFLVDSLIQLKYKIKIVD